MLLLMVATSCEDVLDKQPLDIISDSDVWNDEVLIKAYLTQAYAEMYIFTNEVPAGGTGWNNFWSSESWVLWGFVNDVSDECKFGYNAGGYQFKAGNLNIGGGLLEWWEYSYKVIRNLNVFLQKAPNSPIDDDLKANLMAQARFLRAYSYFSMVKRYGGVPLITVPQEATDPEEELYPVRDKEQVIYDFVLSEMDEIADDLPEENTSADYGTPTKYAALALKSRAALYAASIAKFGTVKLDGVVGIPSSLADDYYQKSYDAAKKIMTESNYSLYNKYPDNKTMNFREMFIDKNNPEAIFVKQHNDQNEVSGGNGWSYDFFQGPYPNGWGEGNQNAPYLEMIDEFEKVDGSSGKLDRDAIQQGLWSMDDLWADKEPRFFATFYTNETPWKGKLLDYHNGIIDADGNLITDGSYNGILAKGNQNFTRGTGFGVLKYLDESVNVSGNWAISPTNWILFRYGEVLLNYAEAAFNLNKPTEALDAVNLIRERAGVALLTSIDREKIRHERKVELAFEGHRYWDLRRWRIADTYLSRSFSGLKFILDYNTKKYKIEVIDDIDGTNTAPKFYEKNYYLPITINRTGQNPNLVENPGY